MTESVNTLIPCNSCGKEISVLADKCPGCGAPNNWIHPKITEFISKKDITGIKNPFNFNWNKYEIWGQTKQSIKVTGWLIILSAVFLTMILFFLFGFWGCIIGGATVGFNYQMALTKFSAQKTFKADLIAKTWQSSDESFWAPIRKMLEL